MKNLHKRNNTQEIKYRNDLLNLIRHDKLDFIMPEAMRKNGIDMMIHIIKRGHDDPFAMDFGTDMGYVVFFLDEGKGMDRALFGNSFAQIADESIYNLISEEKDLEAYVEGRNPQRIGVNMSEWLSHCDGLSHTGYDKLCSMIGREYSKRLESSEMVLTDFRANRVSSEIIALSDACRIQNRIMEDAFRTIVPGKTSLRDVGLHAYGLMLEYGIESNYQGIQLPAIQVSDSDESEWDNPDYIFRQGDLFFWDWGFKYLNFGTDFKRKAYILREGEYELPAIYNNMWESILEVRHILRMNTRPGYSAEKTLEYLAGKIQEAGYVHTPYTDTQEDDRIIQALGNSEKIGFSMDFHCVGNTGNSEVAVGPSIAPFRKDRKDLIVNENNLIAFEYTLHYWHEAMGKRIEMNFEENAVVTSRGIESLYPGYDKILLL